MNKLTIDHNKTALVIIDLQKGIVGRPTLPYSSDLVVKNAAAIANAFRKKEMPIFLVRVKPSLDGKDGLHPIADETMWSGSSQAPPPDWAEIVPELNPQLQD